MIVEKRKQKKNKFLACEREKKYQYTLVSICLKEADFGLADLALITDAGFGDGAAEAAPRKTAPFGCEEATAVAAEGVAVPEMAPTGGAGGAKERARPLDPRRRRASS